MAKFRRYWTSSLRLVSHQQVLIHSECWDKGREETACSMFRKAAKHHPEEFLKKLWNCLTEDEKGKIRNQPFKYLCLRHKIGNVRWGILHVLIRLVCIHVLPCILVLYRGWLECDGSTEMFRISFVTLYALYLVSTVVVFFKSLTDRLAFAPSFLLPAELLFRDDVLDVEAGGSHVAGRPGWLPWTGMEMMGVLFLIFFRVFNALIATVAVLAFPIYQTLLAVFRWDHVSALWLRTSFLGVLGVVFCLVLFGSTALKSFELFRRTDQNRGALLCPCIPLAFPATC